MLLDLTPGKKTAGPLDVICILHDEKGGRFHACFAEEHPFPGPPVDFDEVEIVRLKSKMHHTAGSATLDDAKSEVARLREKIEISDENVWLYPRPWDGEAFVVVVPNWRRAQKTA